MPTVGRMTFGALLRQLRLSRGLSGRALARRAGMDSTYISRLERGVVHPPKVPTVHRLAEALQLEATDEIALIDLSGRLPDTMTVVSRTRRRSEDIHEPGINLISMRETALRRAEQIRRKDRPTAAASMCFAVILPWIVQLYGDRAVPRETSLAVEIYHDSGVSCVEVLPRGDAAVVRIISRFIMRRELSVELSHFLLRENASAEIGSFAIDSNGEVCFQHTIPRSGCTKESLQESVNVVVSAVGRYRELFVADGVLPPY